MFLFLCGTSLKDVETRPIAYWVLSGTVYTSTVSSHHRRLNDVDNATEIDVPLSLWY